MSFLDINLTNYQIIHKSLLSKCQNDDFDHINGLRNTSKELDFEKQMNDYIE